MDRVWLEVESSSHVAGAFEGDMVVWVKCVFIG